MDIRDVGSCLWMVFAQVDVVRRRRWRSQQGDARRLVVGWANIVSNTARRVSSSSLESLSSAFRNVSCASIDVTDGVFIVYVGIVD